mgnify:CR=1 FL=1
MKNIYNEAIKFKKDYPGTVAFRIKQHSSVVERHLNPGEEVTFTASYSKDMESVRNQFEKIDF